MKAFHNVKLFEGLEPESLKWLSSQSHKKNIRKNEHIFSVNSPAENLYILSSGKVEMYRERKGSGKAETVCLISPNEWFCLAPMLSRENQHMNARAISSGKLIVVPRGTIQKLIRQSHVFAQNVIRELAQKECELCENVCSLSLSTTKERLAKYLLEESQRQNANTISISLNQSQLASYLGTVRETVSRDLRSFKNAKLIEQEKTQFTILNEGELMRISGK